MRKKFQLSTDRDRERDILFSDVFEDHVDVDVESPESPNQLLVALHYHPDLRTNAPVNQLCISPRRLKLVSQEDRQEKERERASEP